MSTILYPHDKTNMKKFKKKYNDLNSVYFILNLKFNNMKVHHLLIREKDIALDNSIAINVKNKKMNIKKIY